MIKKINSCPLYYLSQNFLKLFDNPLIEKRSIKCLNIEIVYKKHSFYFTALPLLPKDQLVLLSYFIIVINSI